MSISECKCVCMMCVCVLISEWVYVSVDDCWFVAGCLLLMKSFVPLWLAHQSNSSSHITHNPFLLSPGGGLQCDTCMCALTSTCDGRMEGLSIYRSVYLYCMLFIKKYVDTEHKTFKLSVLKCVGAKQRSKFGPLGMSFGVWALDLWFFLGGTVVEVSGGQIM